MFPDRSALVFSSQFIRFGIVTFLLPPDMKKSRTAPIEREEGRHDSKCVKGSTLSSTRCGEARFEFTSKDQIRALEKEWEAYRKQHQLLIGS